MLDRFILLWIYLPETHELGAKVGAQKKGAEAPLTSRQTK